MSATQGRKRRRGLTQLLSHRYIQRTPTRRGSVIVLESVDPPGATVKYIDQVVSEAPSDIEFRYFSWRTALLGQYDVFHVHWPEFLIRGRRRWVRLGRRALFQCLLLRLRVRGTRVVRTMHNLRPHAEGDAVETQQLRRLDALTSAWVRINQVTAFPPTGDRYTILHGSYRRQFASFDKPAHVEGRLLYIGRIEPYKGVEELVRTFAADGTLQASLRIVGKAEDHLMASIRAAASLDPRIHCDFSFVSDERLVSEICEAELVVLPYREMHNSGIALVALSLDRPILVPESPSNRALADEAGPEWVLRYDGDLSGEAIRNGLTLAGRRIGGPPTLDNRDWEYVAQSYAGVFRGKPEATR